LLVFLTLEYFEQHYQTKNLIDFKGLGRLKPGMSVLLLIGMLSLVGLPITAGFTAKLFVFSGLLEAWSATKKDVLIWLFGFGLLNTVVSLYYYLRIPYYLFAPIAPEGGTVHLGGLGQADVGGEKSTWPLILGVVLAVALLWLFFQPDALMGWINRVSFVAN
jgi:NADH-quinone oxidoreductase subunit N